MARNVKIRENKIKYEQMGLKSCHGHERSPRPRLSKGISRMIPGKSETLGDVGSGRFDP